MNNNITSPQNISSLKYEYYNSVHFYSFKDIIVTHDCPMCGANIKAFSESKTSLQGFIYVQCYRICACCGWWSYAYEEQDCVESGSTIDAYLSQLKCLAVHDPKVPLEQLMKYLSNKPHILSDIHHRKFEEAMAFIYREVYGYEVELTKQTKDKGVDLYIFDSESGKAVVEVKQKRNPQQPVSVSALRGLVGAARPQHTEDIHLITNGRFSIECYKYKEAVEATNLKVRLVDFHDIASALDLLRHDDFTDFASTPYSCPLWQTDWDKTQGLYDYVTWDKKI